MLSDNISNNLSKTVKATLTALLLIGVSGTAVAQNMVVRSVGPSAKAYPAGKKFTNGTKVTLKKLDRLTVLNNGGTKVLKGPGTYTIGSATRTKTGASTRLSSFINNRGRGRARTGAVRGGDSSTTVVAPKNPNLWYLDVTQSGKFCVTNPNALVLWRPDYTGSASASIVEPINGAVTKVEWSKGNPLKAWPKAQAPVSNGAKYQLIGSNVPKTAEIDFVILANTPQNPDEAADVLIKNGCLSQLDLLVERLETENAAITG